MPTGANPPIVMCPLRLFVVATILTCLHGLPQSDVPSIMGPPPQPGLMAPPRGIESGPSALGADRETLTTDAVNNSENTNSSGTSHGGGVHVASWRWSYVKTPFIYTAFIVITVLCKVGFHQSDKLSRLLPESCLLIILGICLGAIIFVTDTQDILPHFDTRTFFLYLLPPIMLESAYSLHDRTFAANIGTILLYAVVGTLINCFTIGPTLYGLSLCGAMGNINLPMTEALTFSALISAVDPVAVLAIFQEVGVNKDLYFLVFGESLLNDAVTVVLYNTMSAFSTMERIPASQVFMGVAVFFCVSLGGLLIGIVFGVITALITKHTKEVRVVEPLAMMGIAYLSYLTAEMVHFSGIISIIACGLVQAQYARHNISYKSYITVKYFSKMISATCDCIIFLFLGMVLVNDRHQWQTGFTLWAALLCLLYRFISVFFLTYLVNKWNHVHFIDFDEQFIMAYGGLRGAVCFSLVVMLDDFTILNKQLFITATLFIILFTVLIQGITIKPLVNLLKIRTLGEKTKSMSSEINVKLMDYIMAGIEEIMGRRGSNYFKQMVDTYDEKYLKKWLQRDSSDFHKFCKVYEKIAIDDHYAHLYGPATALEDKKQLNLFREDDVYVENSDMQGPVTDYIEKPNKEIRESLKRQLSQVSKDGSLTSPVGIPVTHRKDQKVINTLHKALQDNPYNKLHLKHNPNLINDDDQELHSFIRRRRLRSRRLTMTALSPSTSQQSSQAETSDEADNVQMRRPNTKVRSLPSDSNICKTFWIERAEKRRETMRSTRPFQRAQTVDTSSGTPRSAEAQRTAFDFPTVDQSIRPRSTGDLEMRNATLATIDETELNGDGDDRSFDTSLSGFGRNAAAQIQSTHPLLPHQVSLPVTASPPRAVREVVDSELKPLVSKSQHSTPPITLKGVSQDSTSLRRKHRLSKSHPVDIDDDENHESTV